MKLELLRVQRLTSLAFIYLLLLLRLMPRYNQDALMCVLNRRMKCRIDVLLQDEVRGLCLLLLRRLESLRRVK
jgi:hypothetical protein